MLNFKPYRVIMSSLTPVVISGIAPSLDGILYEALSQAIPSNEPESYWLVLRKYFYSTMNWVFSMLHLYVLA